MLKYGHLKREKGHKNGTVWLLIWRKKINNDYEEIDSGATSCRSAS